MNNAKRRRDRRDWARGFRNGQCRRKLESAERPAGTFGAQHPYRLGFGSGILLREARQRLKAEIAETIAKFQRREISADEKNAFFGRIG